MDTNMTSEIFIDCADYLPDTNGIYEVIGTVTTAHKSLTFIQEIEFRDGEWITPQRVKDGTMSIGMWRSSRWR